MIYYLLRTRTSAAWFPAQSPLYSPRPYWYLGKVSEIFCKKCAQFSLIILEYAAFSLFLLSEARLIERESLYWGHCKVVLVKCISFKPLPFIGMCVATEVSFVVRATTSSCRRWCTWMWSAGRNWIIYTFQCGSLWPCNHTSSGPKEMLGLIQSLALPRA